ncbi:erythromycin esterase family protein [Actinomadura logoneensis]|uniref:Erythromycin esterase family protein n=1 Tax=Actinomadura logoneensis TaxID=2293572 RepID=A0A372JB57_9ACTN|nr:erythromycin esterase family protein [Actinomadura logoneensis]RFU36628.1 erythromycin esterase family protein [Actinomadura logoneensis]
MTAPIRDAVRPFTSASLTAMLPSPLRLLGLGEPTHGVEAFPELRNELFRYLVEHEGYRSIALESDCLMGLVADAYVGDGTGTLDEALRRGFSHGHGAYAANRELLRWMRAHNERCAPDGRLRFYGMDGPLETAYAASPREALSELYDYLAAHIRMPRSRADLDELLGPDEPWTDTAVMMDPSTSIGRTPAARELRLLTDDLRGLLAAHAPLLIASTSRDDWWRADLHGRTATGLLRYHDAMADTSPARISTLLSVRATMMADNLDAIVRREERRGPTLVFAHNSHLQRDRSGMGWADGHVEWWGAGAVTSVHLGDRYAFVTTNFGTRGSDVPAPDSLEGMLSELPHERGIVDPRRLTEVLDRKPERRVPADYTYASLDPSATDRMDAVVFVREV